MTDINKVYNDLDCFCQKYNCCYFLYKDLHVYDQQGLPVQMPAFLEKAEQFLGSDYRRMLLESEIIVRYPGGGYDFDFRSNLESGGACCYADIGKDGSGDKNMLMLFDDQTAVERHNMYHEAAHIIQYKHDFYNFAVLEKLYDFAVKEIKYNSGSGLYEKLADAWEYCNYLREAHADTFATACMLLRAEDNKEFKQEGRRSLVRSGMIFYRASKDPEREYPSLRFYTSFPIEKEVVRQMAEYRKSGEDRQFFLPGGEIDMEKLAFAIDDIVIKNAYSPRVFQQILDDDREGRCGIHEKSWRSTLREARWCHFLSFLDRDNENRILRQKVDEHEKRNAERTPVSFQRLAPIDDSAVLLNIACGLDDKAVSMAGVMRIFGFNPSHYAELDVLTALANGRLPDAAVRVAKNKMLKQKPHCGEFMDVMLENYQKGINKLLGVGEIPPEAAGVLKMMQYNPVAREKIWKMYRQRACDSQAKVCPEKFVFTEQKMSRRCRRQLEKGYSQALRRLGRQVNLKDKDRYGAVLEKAAAGFAGGMERLNEEPLKSISDDLYVMYYRHPEVFDSAVAALKCQNRTEQKHRKGAENEPPTSTQLNFRNRRMGR